jgi:hypothetical protein
MRQGSSDLSGSQSALACLCVCARAQLGLWEFNKMDEIQGERDQQIIYHEHNSIHMKVRHPEGTKSHVWLICSGH